VHHSVYRALPVSGLLALLVGLSPGCFAGASSDNNLYAGTVSLSEDFEAGSKTAYAAADVTLATGTWNLNDALIGTTSSDVKTGAKAARMRNSGHITMGFDHPTGAATVTMHHARFGSDANGSWGLFVSQDHGATFTQVGATVATTTATFATATFTVNVAGNVRFDIRKLDGGANRINIDDVTITDFTAAAPDFAVAINPSMVGSAGGMAASTTVSVASINGFSSTVSLSAAMPAGASAVFSPASVAGGSGSSTLTLSPGTAATGSHTVVVTAVGGGITHTATVSWAIGSGGGTALQTVFVIVMENHNWSSIKNSASAPYINNTLLAIGAHAENYVNVPGLHPSEPNYLWLEAGTNFGVTNDNNPSSNHQSSTQHLVTQLQTAGISWKSYQEDISGTTCPLTATGLYAPKHNPMIYFDDVTNTNSSSSQNCIQHVRPYTELATDLQNNTASRYNFITPNLCHDMHNSTGCATTDSVSNGDTWLSTEVPKILASQAYQNGGVILITWDESEGGDLPIGMIVLSPKVRAPGYSNTIAYNHGSTLRTVQEIFGLTPLLGGAATSTDLSDLFSSFGGGGGGGGTGASLSKHTTLGIPSPTSVNDPNSFLSVKADYVVSYNSGRKVPNWVSWELNSSYLGTTARQDDFRPDDTLPASLPQASLADYSSSGFDRGHMCPSADRTLTVAANSQTFFLTNMVPQAANNNRGPWEKLEADVRTLASAGNEVFIIAGGVFGSSPRTIGSGVVVPDQTFKVVVVVGAGQGVSAVNTNTRVIGVLMPNDDSQISLSADWRSFRVSVDTIEAQTGYDFLSDVDPAIQAVIEARVDNQ
jgi:DNA/RNA endonuclease G (NUC1)